MRATFSTRSSACASIFWISPPVNPEVARFKFESASMFRSTRRFSSSYAAMIIRIAPNSSGISSTIRSSRPWGVAGPAKCVITIMPPHATKASESSRSLMVSCRRLSRQITIPTAQKIAAIPYTGEIAMAFTWYAIAQAALSAPAASIVRVHTRFLEYNCAAQKNSSAAVASSHRLIAACQGATTIHVSIAGLKSCSATNPQAPAQNSKYCCRFISWM